MKQTSLAAALPILWLTGCAEISKQNTSPIPQAATEAKAEQVNISHHAVIADRRGLPARATIQGASAKVEARPMTEKENEEYLREMFGEVQKTKVINGKKHLVIFIHGGLNNPKKAIVASRKLVALMQKDEGIYPIAINWDSAALSTLKEHLFEVRQGEFKPVIGYASAPIVLASDLVRGVARAPLVWASLSLSANEQPGGLIPVSRSMLASQQALLHPHPRDRYVPQVTEMSPLTANHRTMRDRLLQATHDLFFLPKMGASVVINSLGTGAWDMMLRRSQLLFLAPTSRAAMAKETRRKSDQIAHLVIHGRDKDPSGRAEIKQLSHDLQELDVATGEPRGTALHQSRPGAVEQFLSQMQTQLGPDVGARYTITLIGHSMGAIVANEMLARHPKLPFDRIVYMAAACSINEGTMSVGSYLERNRNAHFYNLTLHPVSEVAETEPQAEKEDAMFAKAWKPAAALLIPRGSLLVWLDEFFTKPNTAQDRRMGKWRASIRSTNGFPEKVQDRVHVKMFRRGDFKDPQTHGSFTSEGMSFWRPAFWEEGMAKPASERRTAGRVGDVGRAAARHGGLPPATHPTASADR